MAEAPPGTWYWVEAGQGGRLFLDEAGTVQHGAAGGGWELMLFAPDRPTPMALLAAIAGDAPGFATGPGWFAGRAVVLRMVRTAEPEVIGLCLPGVESFLNAAEPDGSGTGAVLPGPSALGAAERFRLVRVPGWAMPLGVARAWVEAAALVLPLARSSTAVLRALAAPHAALLPYLPTVLAAMPRAEFAALAAEAVRVPAVAATLATAFPGDIWGDEAIRALAEWWPARPAPPNRLKIGPALDQLGTAGMDGGYVGMGHRLSAAARRSVGPSRQVCLLATARNEGLYLLEWIAYHRAIGVDHIYLYSNENDDESDGLLAALADAGAITWVDSVSAPNTPAQPKAYGHALGMLPDTLDHNWVLTLDLDEFFVFDPALFGSIGAFIDWHEVREVDVIQLHWLIYGSAGQAHWSDGGLIERFGRRLPYLDMHVKSMYRPRHFMQSRPHVPVCDSSTAPVVRSASGVLRGHALGGHLASTHPVPEASAAWINHYYLKSTDELIWKWSRNRGDDAVRSEGWDFRLTDEVAALFAGQHRGETVADTRASACAPGLAAEFDRLLAAREVRAAWEGVMQAYRRRIAQLREGVRDRAARVPGSPAGLIAPLMD